MVVMGAERRQEGSQVVCARCSALSGQVGSRSESWLVEVGGPMAFNSVVAGIHHLK